MSNKFQNRFAELDPEGEEVTATQKPQEKKTAPRKQVAPKTEAQTQPTGGYDK